MAQTGYTPIQLYRSSTAFAIPNTANLNNGELAINYNTADMALYAKNTSGNLIMLMNNPAGLVYPTADGITGQVMATDGAGQLTLNTNLYADGTSVLIETGGTYSNIFGDGANFDNIYTTGASGHHDFVTGVDTIVRIDANGAFVDGGMGVGYTSVTGTNTVATAGKLGVGTSNPTYYVDARGATGNGIAYYDSTVRNFLGTISSTTGVIGTLTNHALAFYTNNTQRASITASGTLTLVGSTAVAAMLTPNILETATILSTPIFGTPTVAFDITTQSVMYYTPTATSNWKVNFRASSGTSLNSMMSNGQAITAVMLVTQGSTAYYNTEVQVDGTTVGVTTKWQGGSAPIQGSVNGIDAYTYTIIKTQTTPSVTYTVLASQTQFA